MLKKSVKLDFGDKSYLLVPISNQDYYQYSKQGIPINEDSMGYITILNMLEKFYPHIGYAHYYIALKGLFGEGDDSYDRYKCSYGYLFLLKIIDDNEEYIYTLNFTDIKGCYSFYFKKILTTQKEFKEYGKIPKDLLHEPFNEFSQEDIRDFMGIFLMRLMEYILAHEESYNEEFIKYQEYCFTIYGYKDGKFFVKEYDYNKQEEQDKFYEEKRRLEELQSKNKCLRVRELLEEYS